MKSCFILTTCLLFSVPLFAQRERNISLSAGPNFTFPFSNKEQVNYGFEELKASRGFQAQVNYQWFNGRFSAFNIGIGFLQNRLGWRDPSVNFRDTLHPRISRIPDLVGPPRTADYFYNFHYVTIPFSYKRYLNINTNLDLLYFAWSVGVQLDVYLFAQTYIKLEGYTIDEQDRFRFIEKTFNTSPVNVTPMVAGHVEYGITNQLYITGKATLAANVLPYKFNTYSATLLTPTVNAGLSWQLGR